MTADSSHILASIEGALTDYETSYDAMRWTPEPEQADTAARASRPARADRDPGFRGIPALVGATVNTATYSYPAGLDWAREMARQVTQPPSHPHAAAAARTAAVTAGIDLPQHAAEAIAEAVLSYADGVHEVCILVTRLNWPQHRDVAHSRLTVKLAEGMAENGWIPTSLPQTDVRDDPTDLDAPPAYRRLMVTMWVPYRRAPARPASPEPFGLREYGIGT